MTQTLEMKLMMDKFQKFLEQEYDNKISLPLDKVANLDIPRAKTENCKVKGFYVEPDIESILDQLAAMKKRKGIKSDIMNAALRKYFSDLGFFKDSNE